MEKMALMKETGETINLMDLVFKVGKMEANSKEIIIKALNIEMENIHGLINQLMKETGNMAKLMDRDFIFMSMEEFMKARLKTTKCKVREFILGQMEESILDHIKKIKNMG